MPTGVYERTYENTINQKLAMKSTKIRKKLSDIKNKQFKNDTEYRQRVSIGTKKAMAKQEVKNNLSRAITTIMNHPERKNKLAEYNKIHGISKERKKKISIGVSKAIIEGRMKFKGIYKQGYRKDLNDGNYYKSSLEANFERI